MLTANNQQPTTNTTAFLRELILAEHGKAQIMRIVHWIGDDEDRVGALMEIVLGDEYRLTQRGAWAVRYVGEAQPELLRPWYPKMLEILGRKGIHDALKRNILNVFEDITIPTEVQDELTDHCFQYVENPQEAIAIRCAAMSILEKTCAGIPELQQELALILEPLMQSDSPGIKSRVAKVLGRLKKGLG